MAGMGEKVSDPVVTPFSEINYFLFAARAIAAVAGGRKILPLLMTWGRNR